MNSPVSKGLKAITWSHWRRVRQAVQLFFFALFIYLLFSTVERREAPALVDLFFRLNPLSALTATLATRSWVHGLEWALLIVVLTLVAGRVWCGWICPFGTLLEWVSFRKAQKRAAAISPKLRKIKYFLLGMILIAALFGNLTLLVFDPIAIFTRTMTTAVIPALNYGINAVEATLYPVSFLRPAINWVEGALRGSVLPVKQPAFAQNIAIASLFIAILALNTLAHRFWCRYLCPLGALLGLLSRVSFLRPVVGPACNRCTRCAIVCRPGAVDTRPETIQILPSECTLCLDCLANCKKDDMRLSPVLKPAPSQEYDLSRRDALAAIAAGTAGLLLLRTDLRSRQRNPLLIRPPGANDENAFLSSCLRCSQCMKICPTSALQPAVDQAGLEGYWTPVLTPRVGYCDYGCTACGQVCPSGAIPLLSLEDKRVVVVGKATVNRNRCLPWASAIPCIVCEEMCPTPQKSIRLEEVEVTTAAGEQILVQRPYVLREICIGCGICENHCPLEGEAAIRVFGI